ncbi:MAG TPA: pyruvate kinase [Candidatus Binatus sp.]|uniref:pyruvate kinase n=1 Tax=Candidatus Binatus sp. TaxID=2811406 RepID=UPI002B482186|nr:pyruvate kinase [Candidatus Binatus sp.]HKN12673.1 pyruvate kinase [Candidatus Binatus sp.]
MKNESASPVVSTDSFGELISKLHEILCSLIKHESDLRARASAVHPAYRKSAINLIHYLALRHQDIRTLQEELAALGLSSLGRTEAHVMSTLNAVLVALHHLAGRQIEVQAPSEYPGFREGRSLLAAHTEALLGPAPEHRNVRIMVTMSSEAADDYPLVRDLVSRGMNCMRINCAHDTPEVWGRMVNHLERARRELGLPCRLLMDLAGPKLRTGAIEPGPRVVVWHPKRDGFGRVTEPARIWLEPAERTSSLPAGADAALSVSAQWLAEVRAGERIHFKDARGKRRVLEVVGGSEKGRWARCSQTAYVTPGTALVRDDAGKDTRREVQVGDLPPREQGIMLHKGDFLLLTRAPILGKNASIDSGGRTLTSASISCTLPEIFSKVKAGQKIWFDDGKIGGIVREVEPDALRIEITHARARGDRLGADKGINLPDTSIGLPAITPKDLEDLEFVVRHADLVGMSFVRHERDILQLQARLRELGGSHLGIVLKIETRQGFERLPSLMLATMRQHPVGIMIARGDLAVECGYERLAEVQEEILWICEAAHLPVIWATQVLESLAKKGQPTRAEITDAAMGERAECVMLNKGPHIVAAVSALDDILRRMQDHQSKKSSRLRPLHLSATQESE